MRPLFFLLLSAGLAAGPAGCGSAARRIDPGSSESLVTLSGIDPSEWRQAAADSADSLLASGALRRKDGQAPVVMIGRIRNQTLMHLETGLLTDKLRQAIGASGQAAVTSAVGAGSNIDLAVRRIRSKELDDLFHQGTVPRRGTVIAPNFSLSGAIIQQMSESGRTEESYFLFHLVLTDLATGVAVWEHNTEFAKQATRPLM